MNQAYRHLSAPAPLTEIAWNRPSRGGMVHRLADAARWTQGLVAHLDTDGPHISSPVVHVLEELAVDRSQVRKIV
jgi:hypothetical protein